MTESQPMGTAGAQPPLTPGTFAPEPAPASGGVPTFDVADVQPSAQAQDAAPTAPPPYTGAPAPASRVPTPAPWVAPAGADQTGLIVEPAPSRYLLGVLAGVAAGAVAAFAYAAVSSMMQREVLWFAILIGVAVGLTTGLVARRGGALTGLIAAAISLGAYLLAAVLEVEFLAAGSIPDGIDRLSRADVGGVLSLYFEDPLGYVWLLATVVFGFINGMRVKSS